MKRKLAFLVTLVSVIVLIFGVIRFFIGRSPRLGELRVDSSPTANVFLDSKLLGRSPFQDKVTSGEYTIKLVPDSAVSETSSWQGKVSIGQNLLTFVNANLSESELTSAVDVLWLEKISSKNSEFSITTNPDGASIAVDGETKGVSPLTLTDVSIGEHTLVITSPGFAQRSLKVKTTAGYKLIVSMKLALSSVAPTPEATSSPTPSVTVKLTPTPKTATSSADPAKPFVIIKDTPTGFLRVRMEPSTSATESARVNPGEKYHLFSEKSGWYQIEYEVAKKGWISGQYAEKVE